MRAPMSRPHRFFAQFVGRSVQVGVCNRNGPNLATGGRQDLADRMTIEGLSASTVQNTLDPLRVIYRRAIRRDEGVTIDPTEGLELRRAVGTRERIAAADEADSVGLGRMNRPGVSPVVEPCWLYH